MMAKSRRALSRAIGRSVASIRPVFRMEIASLVNVLEQPHLAAEQLHDWGVVDVHQAQQTLRELAESGLTLDLLAALCAQMRQHLPHTPDPDAGLSAFARFLFATRSPLSLVALLERDRQSLPILLAALSLGPRWAEFLARDPEAFDFLRQTEGRPCEREELHSEILAEVLTLDNEQEVAATLQRVKFRHELRIAYGEVTQGQRWELVAQQLSLLAEAIAGAALQAAQRQAVRQRPLPRGMRPEQLTCVLIAVGRLGGGEMDYGSPLELLFTYDAAVAETSQIRAARDHFERVAKLFVQLLQGDGHISDHTYQVVWQSLPDSSDPAAAHLADDVVLGFDSFGRTWHRQAMLQARPIAGDTPLGAGLLGRLQSWLFRRYLSPADETGILAWKRRVLLTAHLHQDEHRSLGLARGGLRDLESTIQLLQLLVGGDHEIVRRGGILPAIAGLEQAGVLTAEERNTLEAGYLCLRRLENRLQIRFGTADSLLPDDNAGLTNLAGAIWPKQSAGEIRTEIQSLLDRTWSLLARLLSTAFAEEPSCPREVELLLDPQPPGGEIRAALAPFGFTDPPAALATLQQLAQEQVPFLSTRRCRHALAQILPQLLCAIAATPNPDRTLDKLLSVTNSLGSKGALWELFRFHNPSLLLYVRLCAASPYLANILATRPGMIDELVDSLQLRDLPSGDELQARLAELCRGAADTLPVLHEFKLAQHLRIGVRDMEGQEDIDRTHFALADVAEACLTHLADLEFSHLQEKFGIPTIGPGPFQGEPCRLVIVGLGKLGGREPNYHSDLDLLFLYEAEGLTRWPGRTRREQTTNNHFFTQLAQRLLKQLTQLTPQGRLYAADVTLRPIGVGGSLALSFADFAQHFSIAATQPDGQVTAPLWQWQSLCKARPVYGETTARAAVENLLAQLLTGRGWSAADRAELYRSRLQMERGAARNNLKRGPGGTSDIEFLVQMLQLRHAGKYPQVLATDTQDGLRRLAKCDCLDASLARQLGDSYRFLRRVESGLRLLETAARHDLPTLGESLHQLAIVIGHSNAEKLRQQCLAHMSANRAAFEQLVSQSAT
jgi:glutamate-ammonia-ligase adenylyltransferase